MHTSEEGKLFIKDFEKLKLTAYDDGYGYWTIGWGHTTKVRPGHVIDEERAEVLFEQDLNIAEDAVNDFVDVGLEQHQFDALVSFVFNVGAGAFRNSTLLRLLNGGGCLRGVEHQFQRWNKVSGKVSNGLTRRRAAEQKMFEGGA